MRLRTLRSVSEPASSPEESANAPEAIAAVDASILVPVYNEERYIERSVAAMRRQRFAGTLEFVFADGGSTDRTREILDRLATADSRIRVFDNPNRSVSSGLNVALRHARGRWVVRMDAHTEFPEDYVALGVRRLRVGDTRWVSGPQVPKGVGRVSRAVSLALASRLGRGGSRKWGESGTALQGEWELDTGVFDGVWERETLLEYGGWDERWPRNEDSEMAARFFARGERLVCVGAMGADYVPRDSFLGLWRQYLGYGEFRTKTAAHYPQTLRLSQLLPPGIVLTALLACCGPHRLRSSARFVVACYAAGLGAAGAGAFANARPRSDALLVPGVLAVMHFAHGTGMLLGTIRHEFPLASLISLARSESPSEPPHAPARPVHSPSLH